MNKKTLILVLNNKGGCGKTFVASAMICAIEAVNREVVQLDIDGGNSDLRLLHPSACFAEQKFDDIIEIVEEAKDIVVADFPAGSIDAFLAWTDELGFFEAMASGGVRVVIVIPVTNQPSCPVGAKVIIDELSKKRAACEIVVALNFVEGPPSAWLECGARKRALEDGAKEVSVPQLYPKLAQDLRNKYLTLVSWSDAEKLSGANRLRLEKYSTELFSEIQSAIGIHALSTQEEKGGK
jgi:hypothetical protein